MRPFITGNTGRSTGPHLDARLWRLDGKGGGEYIDPEPYIDALRVGEDAVAKAFRRTSGFGPRPAPMTPQGPGSSFHRGHDYATPEGTAITVQNGRWLRTEDIDGYGRISSYAWDGPDGGRYEWRLAHGREDGNPLGVATDAALPVAAAPDSSVPTVHPLPEQPPVPDWRAAASAPGRSTDPSDPAYWEREDMRQWAQANPGLAAPLLSQAGVQLSGAPAPAAAPAFQPLSSGPANGVQITDLGFVDGGSPVPWTFPKRRPL